jgi:hypothetical protein
MYLPLSRRVEYIVLASPLSLLVYSKRIYMFSNLLHLFRIINIMCNTRVAGPIDWALLIPDFAIRHSHDPDESTSGPHNLSPKD